jgi:hypothetical protein
MCWDLIIGYAAVGVIWIVSEPTLRLRSLYKKNDWFMRLMNCAMCSTFHIYFWSQLFMTSNIDILGASISAIISEFVVRKLNEGSL